MSLEDYDNDMQYVEGKIRNEGFDYAFVHYSRYEDIKDEKFHELRKKFLEARKELNDYVMTKAKDE